MSVSELRARLRETIERVRQGEEVRITRSGEDAAVLVHPSRLRARRVSSVTQAADELADDLQRRRSETTPPMPGTLAKGRAEDLVDRIRSDRDAR